MKRIKQSCLTHPSDWSKLSSMTKSKIRSKETEMEFTRASAFMFRSTQEIWSKMPAGISTFPSRGRAGWPKPAPSLRRPIALSMQVPLIRFDSCCRRQEGTPIFSYVQAEYKSRHNCYDLRQMCIWIIFRNVLYFSCNSHKNKKSPPYATNCTIIVNCHVYCMMNAIKARTVYNKRVIVIRQSIWTYK